MVSWTNEIIFEYDDRKNLDDDKWICTTCETEYDNPLDAVQCNVDDCSVRTDL